MVVRIHSLKFTGANGVTTGLDSIDPVMLYKMMYGL